MAKTRIKKTPTKDNKFTIFWRYIQGNQITSCIILVSFIAIIIIAIVCQCKSNNRPYYATLWRDFKIAGLYFAGLLSPTIMLLIGKFNAWINK